MLKLIPCYCVKSWIYAGLKPIFILVYLIMKDHKILHIYIEFQNKFAGYITGSAAQRNCNSRLAYRKWPTVSTGRPLKFIK